MTPSDRSAPCPRCLLSQTPGAEALAQTLRQWIDALPEERRADPAALEARLAACRACEHLAGGTCALCGCYVEYRAAQANRRCPDVPGRWQGAAAPINN